MRFSACVTGLQNKPDTAAIDPRFFAVLDEKAASEEKTIVLCKIGARNSVGELEGGSLHSARFDTKFSTSFLTGMDAGD